MLSVRLSSILLLTILLAGCQFETNEKLEKVTIDKKPDAFNVMEVTNPKDSLSLTIRHMVSNDDVFVECYVPDFEFGKEMDSIAKKAGYLQISVDGKDPYPVYKAAFVVKDLSKGTHNIDVTLVDYNGDPIDGMKKQLFVTIP